MIRVVRVCAIVEDLLQFDLDYLERQGRQELERYSSQLQELQFHLGLEQIHNKKAGVFSELDLGLHQNLGMMYQNKYH